MRHGTGEPPRPLGAALTRSGLRRRAVRAASLTAGSFFGTQLLTLVVYVALARLTTPEVFGIFAAASLVVGAAELLTQSGITTALVQQRQQVEAAAATAFISTLTTSTLASLLALAASPILGLYFQSPEIAQVAAVLSPSLLITGIAGVPGALMQRRLLIRRWVVVEPLSIVAMGAGSAIGLVNGWDVWALVVGWYCSVATRAIVMWIVLGWVPQLRLASWRRWKEMARYGRYILASLVLQDAKIFATTAGIGKFLGASSLGEFRYAWRLVTQAISPVLVGTAYALQPTIVQLGEDAVRTRETAVSALRLVCAVAAPISASFLPFGEPLAVLLLGEEWRRSGLMMMALSGVGLGMALEWVAVEIFKARGLPHLVARMQTLSAALSISLMVVFIPFGDLAVALTFSVSSLIVSAYGLSRLVRVVNMPGQTLRAVLIPSICGSSFIATSIFLFDRYMLSYSYENKLMTLQWLLVEAFVGVLCYASIIFIFSRETAHEMRRTFLSLRASQDS